MRWVLAPFLTARAFPPPFVLQIGLGSCSLGDLSPLMSTVPPAGLKAWGVWYRCCCVLVRKGSALTHRIHHRFRRIFRALLLGRFEGVEGVGRLVQMLLQGLGTPRENTLQGFCLNPPSPCVLRLVSTG